MDETGCSGNLSEVKLYIDLPEETKNESQMLSSLMFLVVYECLGLFNENENTTGGMLEIMHANVPSWTSDEEVTHFTDIGHAGDQLTVERAINSLLAVSNEFTATEGLEGMHFEIADWHTELKFLDVSIIVCSVLLNNIILRYVTVFYVLLI